MPEPPTMSPRRVDGSMSPRRVDGSMSPRRVDGSMSLLVDMMANTLDEAYADRARAERARGRIPATPATPRRRSGIVGVAVLIALGLVTGTAIAAVRDRSQAAGGSRDLLAQQVRERSAATDALADDARRLAGEVEAVRSAALGADVLGRATADRLARLGLASGMTPVRGPGLIVTLDDAPAGGGATDPATRPGSIADDRVQDRDLQDVVNALWAAGAEAISVNGQRLTALTAIRSAGETILVDFSLLSPPYRISAVGAGNRLQVALVDGPVGRRLNGYVELYGLSFSVRSEDELTLPAASSPDLRAVEQEPAP